MWCIWRERKWRTFEDMESSNNQLLASFCGFFFCWSRAWRLTFSDSLLCSIVPSYVISIFFVFFNPLSVIFDLPYAFLYEVAFCLYIFTVIQANQQSINWFRHINNLSLPCKSPNYLLLLFFQRAKSSFGKTCYIFPVLKNPLFFFFFSKTKVA